MSDLAKKRPELNLDNARALGLRFCAERHARQLSQQDIADELLLSKLQVIGLETGDQKSFYSAKMFGQAADKYAHRLSFEDKPSESLFQSDADSIQTETPIETVVEVVAPAPEGNQTETDSTTLLQSTTTTGRPKLRIAFVAVGVMSLIAVLYNATVSDPVTAAINTAPPAKPIEPVAKSNQTPTTENSAATPTPTTLAQNTPEKTEPVKTEPSKVVTTEKPATTDNIAPGTIQLKFNASSWVQAVDKNGSKQDKVYRSGETLNLEPNKLQALIIGNASAVTVNDSKAQISLKPYMASGSQVARIVGPDIRKLAE